MSIDRTDKHGPYNIPWSIHEGLVSFKFEGRPTGDFIRTVIENDLSGAIGRADPESEACLKDICRWVYWELPASSLGSDGYMKWVAMGGLEGKQREVDHATAIEINEE